MTDPLDGLPPYPPIPSVAEHASIDSSTASNIPISDFRRNEARPILTDDDRHKSIYHQPSLTKYNPTERHRKRRQRSQTLADASNVRSKSFASNATNESFEIDNPSARIQFLLGDEDQDEDDEEHKPHDLFIELSELISEGEKVNESGESIEQGWKETARWVKFEEDVESGGRWSKPHVASLSLHSLLELRNCLFNGSVLLDMQADQFSTIIDVILDDMIAHKSLSFDKRQVTRNALLLKHIHQHEKEFHRHLHTQELKKPLPFTRSLAEMKRNWSQKDVTASSADQMPPTAANPNQTPTHKANETTPDKFLSVGCGDPLKSRSNEPEEFGVALPTAESRSKINLAFMRKIPPNSEATTVLVGAVDFLQTPVYAFVRLAKGVTIPDLIEVPLPTRFLFILLGPCTEHCRYHEIGRSIGTLMSDEIFRDIAYRGKHRQDLLAGIDDFLDHVTVLPPGEWDPKTRIEPPKSVPNKEDRLDRNKMNGGAQADEAEHAEHELDPSLVRTGRFCGGLIDDIKRKAPFYLSDFTDAISFQSVATIIFLYFACLSPIITFGGLLSKATDNNMAAIESLLSGAICGCLYHLFAGQPLAILGSTGPVLVFETIVNHFCTTHGFDYMNFRCWIGLWTTFILIIMVVTDASYLVKYITRFTEESFAALIGIIFIYEAFDKMLEIKQHRPVRLHTVNALPSNCTCTSRNWTSSQTPGATINDCIRKQAYQFDDINCGDLIKNTYIPDVFFFSVMLFASTFILAYTLKNFKFSRFLPMTIRSKISDFGVVLAIFINVLIDYKMGLDTPKLNVPRKFATTKEGRGWIINPFGKNPALLWFAAIIPALLATILIFMDQHITAVIINRKENKLKKGSGYHLDLFIVALCIGTNSILGLPWFVAATVLSINHVIALKLESETAAPGEKAKFLGVREQRVTGVVVFLFIGLSVFLTKFLGLIPMPVLYGVFLYMGISSMKEIQLISRILLIFMPEKYQPDYVYLRYVRTSRVHLFTIIQLTCLALLWIIKSVKSISILFPIMVLALVGARKLMDYMFTQRELGYLDDVMPEIVKKEIEERRNSVAPGNTTDPSKTGESITFDSGEIRISVGDGKVVKVPRENVQINPSTGVINFSDEVAKTFLWKSIAKSKDKTSMAGEKKSSSIDKSSRSSGIKNRIRKLSLSFLSPDEDRALVSINSPQLPAIVIEQPEPSIASGDPQSRRTSLHKSDEDTKL